MSQPRSSNRTFAQSVSSRFTFGVRCLLWLLVAWQAPIPWADYHGTFGHAPTSEPVWLAAHLRTHHAATSPTEVTFLGWHMHADFPVVPGQDPEQAGGTSPERYCDCSAASAYSVAESVARGAMTAGWVELAALSMGGGLLHRQADSCSSGPATFFASFCPTRSLPARLGMLRI